MLSRSTFIITLILSSITATLSAPAPIPQNTNDVEPITALTTPVLDATTVASASASRARPTSSSSASASNNDDEEQQTTQLSGDIKSDIPISCLVGCSQTQVLFENCNSNPNSIYCTEFCTNRNYTRSVTCLNCLVDNGAGFTTREIQNALDSYTKHCKRVKDGRFRPVSKIEGSATTTEAKSTSLKRGESLPTWSGFNGILDSKVAMPTDYSNIGRHIAGLKPGQKRRWDVAAQVTGIAIRRV